MSSSEGKIHPLRKDIVGLQDSLKSPIRSILRTGHVPMLSRYMQRTRSRIGLPSIPPTAYSNTEYVNQMFNLIKSIGAGRRIGFDFDRRDFKY
ncbi:MAG: hypothetical protein NDF58_06655 [archaeon YNP-LCB-024-027]|jgi:heterodisulfide reductase subunit C|nr:hypothetical protein [Candidatus Culexarchaeum yellowstonense]